MIRRYIGWHFKKLKNVFRFDLSGSGRRLELFFNLHSYLVSQSERLKFDKISQTYILTSDVGTRYFVSSKTAKWSYWNGTMARGESMGKGYFLDQVEFNAGDLVVDCGAHIGDLKLYFDTKGLEIEYIGFEPSPKEFLCLKKNVQPSLVYNLGLWNFTGDLKFFVSSQNADSSFIEPKMHSHDIKMKVSRLDELEFRNIKLLKLEAEGGELEVLQGCKNILQNIQYISADLGFERGISEENTLPNVINFLLEDQMFKIISAVAPSGRLTVLFENTKKI